MTEEQKFQRAYEYNETVAEYEVLQKQCIAAGGKWMTKFSQRSSRRITKFDLASAVCVSDISGLY